jgi:hypothetical protein
MWDAVVAWFLCVPASYATMVPDRHWQNHARLVAFVFAVVLPLSGLSWAHLVGLLIGPRDTGWAICTVAAVFMMAAVLLTDSMLCGALGQRRFTPATFAVFCFRWLLAISAATSLAIGGVLFVMGDQLARERAEQSLAMQETDRMRVGQIHDLAALAKSAAAAKNEVARTEVLLASTPVIVSSLIASHDTCQAELHRLQDENSRRLPPLEGAAARLRAELRRPNASSDEAARLALPATAGQLRETEIEIGQFTGRVTRKVRECTGYQMRARDEDRAHKEKTSQKLTATEKAKSEAEQAWRSAETAAAAQLDQLNTTTALSWSENLSAQLKAAWAMIEKEWWARIVAATIFVVCLVIEMSPMLGKVALRGGALDQLGEVEEEAARQRFLTRLAATQSLEEAERSVLNETRKEQIEIVSIRKAAEAVFDNAEELRRRRDALRDFPDLKDLADTVFTTARDKMRDCYIRLIRSMHRSEGVQ